MNNPTLLGIASCLGLVWCLGQTGCSGITKIHGVRPIYPLLRVVPPATVKSLRPAFKWAPLRGESVRYDLVVRDLGPAELFRPGYHYKAEVVYTRQALVEATHTIQQDLLPGTLYDWSVRSVVDGETSAWSTFDGMWDPDQLRGAQVLVNTLFTPIWLGVSLAMDQAIGDPMIWKGESLMHFEHRRFYFQTRGTRPEAPDVDGSASDEIVAGEKPPEK